MRQLRPLALAAAAALAFSAFAVPAEGVTLRKTFSQTTPIHLGDGGDGPFDNSPNALPASGTSGIAATYPAQATWNESTQPIVDVNVSVILGHTHPDDIELLLVGPGGQQALLMANAGGSTDFSGAFRFDDEAAEAIPDDGDLVDEATYRPAGYDAPEALPAPAPALNGNSALSVFDGTSGAGTWSLYAYDDTGTDTGSINYWYVDIVTATTPYPSTINVSGAGSVTDVNVNLSNVSSSYPDDVDLLLVGPQGQQATLMSDVGGSSDAIGVNLTLDDEAGGAIPDAGPLTSGSFRPTDVADEEDIYPAPAPAPTGSTLLSVFDGTNANGTWRLFAWDSVGGDYTSIGGWSLDIESDDSAAPTGSVVIAGGAATVKTRSVSLSLSASDPGAASGVTQMRFSNDGTTWSAFQPYATTAAWTLAAGKDGVRTVSVQFADAFGNVSTAASDTVTLDTTSPTVKKTSPKKNATGVSPKAKVKVVASEKLAKATVNAKNVVLKKGSKKVKAKVTLKKGTTIVLKPKKPLADGTYKVSVKKVTDLAGNQLDAKKKKGVQAVKWKFTV